MLCRDKRGLIAEYALKDIDKPIGVSEYKLLNTLPKEYESLLPTAEDIMSRIDMDEIDEEGANDHLGSAEDWLQVAFFFVQTPRGVSARLSWTAVL